MREEGWADGMFAYPTSSIFLPTYLPTSARLALHLAIYLLISRESFRQSLFSFSSSLHSWWRECGEIQNSRPFVATARLVVYLMDR